MIPSHLAQLYLGPQVPIGATRNYLDYKCELAPSYVPTRLFFQYKPPNLKVALQSIQLHEKVQKLVIKSPIDLQLIEDLKDDLKNHVEGRIQLFLQQMVLIYKQNLPLEVYKRTHSQIGQIPSKGVQEPPYVAAHSSTLPILRLAQSEPGNTFTSLAHDTSFYYAWNTTVYLPLIANEIDSEIDRSLRDHATAILNQVSLGKCNPEKGLSVFLTLLLKTITSIKKILDTEKKILSTYSQIVDNYLTNTTNGYPLLQKLCLRPIEERIDDRFYHIVQTEIHNRFKAESRSPETVVLPQLAQGVDLIQIQEMIATRLLAFPIRETAGQYVCYFLSVDKVRGCAITYLNYLHEQPFERIEEELNYILQSNATFSLQKETYEASGCKGSGPQNMDLILLSILYKCSQKLVPPPPASFYLLPEAENQLKMQIARQIKETPSSTALKHVKVCLNAVKVQAAAKVLFNRLLFAPFSVREIEINKFHLVKESIQGWFNLSKEAIEFCKMIWEVLGKKPKKFPGILFKVLSALPNHSPPQIEEGKM